MKWHPFKADASYPVSEIIPILLSYLESGNIRDVSDKARIVGLLDPYVSEKAIFRPFSTGWGASPYNLSTWRSLNGDKLVKGYKDIRRRKIFSEKTRTQVIAKTGGYCYSCGEKFKNPCEVWIEHIIPFSVGGSDEMENLLPGCKLCNWTRRNFSPSKIRRILSVGSVAVQQLDKETDLGKAFHAFLEKEELRRAKARKSDHEGYLVFKS